METGNDSNLRYEHEPPTAVAVMIEDNWENHEVFEEDLSNPELAAVTVEYVEKANGYYPLSSESDNVMGDNIGLVLNAEQEQAVQAALAGGLATVEVLTPFGTDATEVWSIQTYASSGVTPSGERSFTLTSVVQERQVLVEEIIEDGDESASEMLEFYNDGGGDIIVSFPVEQPTPVSEAPPVFNIIIEDSYSKVTEPFAEIQCGSIAAPIVESVSGNNAIHATEDIEQETLVPLPHTQSQIEALPFEPISPILDESEDKILATADELPAIANSELKAAETHKIMGASDRPVHQSQIEVATPIVELETAPPPNRIDVQIIEETPTARTVVEFETETDKAIPLSQETEIEYEAVLDPDLQQPLAATLAQDRSADHHIERSNVVLPAPELAVPAIESVPNIARMTVADEPIRHEVPADEAEYIVRLAVVKQEDVSVNEEAVEHSTLASTFGTAKAQQSSSKTELLHKASEWEVSGFETSSYGLLPGLGVAVSAEDDIVIPFQSTIRTQRSGQARRMRSSVV